MGNRCGICRPCCNKEEKNDWLQPNRTPVNPDYVDISHFNMVAIIGKGGFAEVYLAIHRLTNEKVAIKRIQKREVLVLRNHHSNNHRRKSNQSYSNSMSSNNQSNNNQSHNNQKDWSLRTVVFTERNAMIGLKSPFLMPLFHAFQDSTALYLTMPFMNGGDLGYYIRHNRLLTEEEARYYAVELILGLEELHMIHHIIYRDLKPSNIMLNSDGHICLCDFGLCAQLRKERDWRTTGNVGTVGYQSPEIVQRRPYGFGVDFFSLGVTIYRIITGKRPYGKSGVFRQPPELSYFSKDLRDLLCGLLEIDQNKRLGSGYRYNQHNNNNNNKQNNIPSGVCWDEIKSHYFFKSIDWKAMSNKLIDPPLRPKTINKKINNKKENFLVNFPTSHSLRKDSKHSKHRTAKYPSLPLSFEQQQLFDGFEYNVEIINNNNQNNNNNNNNNMMMMNVLPLSSFQNHSISVNNITTRSARTSMSKQSRKQHQEHPSVKSARKWTLKAESLNSLQSSIETSIDNNNRH